MGPLQLLVRRRPINLSERIKRVLIHSPVLNSLEVSYERNRFQLGVRNLNLMVVVKLFI